MGPSFRFLLGSLALSTWFVAGPALAQDTPPPGPAPQPEQPPQPAPAPAPPPQQQPYPPYAQQPAPQEQPYPGQQPVQPAPNYAAAPPPTQAQPPLRRPMKLPDFSIRVDPLNWLLLGRLGLEFEVEALEWLTVEMVPVFVTTEEPVLFGDGLHQESNGLGPLAGASIGVGFWLDGDSFNGTVLRAGLTNYGYKYFGISPVDVDPADINKGDMLKPVTHTERRLSFMIGSGRTWGAFTIAGGFGLEYELNQRFSCIIREGGTHYTSSTNRQTCVDRLPGRFDDEDLLVSTRPDTGEYANVNGYLHPFDIVARISLGIVLDD